MTVLKWVLVIFGVLFLATAAALFGLGYWASGIESVKMTPADLEIGGSYPPEEKQALISACETSVGAERAASCTCLADRAGSEFSRFERLIFTATFDRSPSKIVAVTKGLLESGAPPEKTESLERDSEQRLNGLMQACGLK